MRRWLKPLIYTLVLGQVLLSAPMVNAMSGATGSDHAEMACADSMPHAADSGSCPCCPEGDLGTAACLSSCAATLAAVSTIEFSSVAPDAAALPDAPLVHVAQVSDPPLKPPPIV